MYRFNLFCLGVILSIVTSSLSAQEDSSWHAEPTIDFSGFIDIYYAYDYGFDRSAIQSEARQQFLFNHNRHNQFNLNLGLIQCQLSHPKYRANIGLQSGTYANDNYAAEDGVFQNVYEANVGLSLNKTNTLWMDAGIFGSHLGFESAISSDNMTLTRSLAAENSPYYLAGGMLSYTPNDQWLYRLILANGWQRIRRVPGNSLVSYGTQIQYTPNENTTFNWSTFVTTEYPDEDRRMRYFNNLYAQFQLAPQLSCIVGFDTGFEQRTMGSDEYTIWWAPTLITQYQINDKWHTAARVEYFDDEDNIALISTIEAPIEMLGLSWNLDYRPNPNVTCRFETRYLSNPVGFYVDSSFVPQDKNLTMVASVAIKI